VSKLVTSIDMDADTTAESVVEVEAVAEEFGFILGELGRPLLRDTIALLLSATSSFEKTESAIVC